MKWYLKVIRQAFDFSTRARRMEYWMFVLINFLFCIVAAVLDNVLGLTFKFDNLDGNPMPIYYGWIYIIYGLFAFIPGLAVLVRRLHDTGKSGWMFLIVLIPVIGWVWILVLLFTDSQPHENKWGHNPKGDPADFLEPA